MELFFGLLVAFFTVDVETFFFAFDSAFGDFFFGDADVLFVVVGAVADFLAAAFFVADFLLAGPEPAFLAAALPAPAALVVADFFAAFAPCAFLLGATVMLSMLVLSVPRTNAFWQSSTIDAQLVERADRRDVLRHRRPPGMKVGVV